MKYTVIYEQGQASWGTCLPDLPGVVAVGDSRAEVEALIADAVEFHLDSMRE
jgi:predicted RNase H-like HicB family nuclease